MSKFKIYANLTWLCALSMFLPTSPLTSRIEKLLEELKVEKQAAAPRS